MHSFLDSHFQTTKSIIQGNLEIDPIARELAEWISKTYSVNALSVILETNDINSNIILKIILEHQSEVQKFWDESKYQYSENYKKSILEKLSTFTQYNNKNVKFDNGTIVFYAFTPLVIQEAFSKIRESEFRDLKKRLNNQVIWEIPNQLGYPAIFVYTNAQLTSDSIESLKNFSRNEFYRLIKKFDELNFLNQDNFHVHFDSKEKLDSDYGGNWFNYWHG